MTEEEVVIKAIFEKDEEQIETAAFEITKISKLEHMIGDQEALTIDVKISETAYQMQPIKCNYL